MSTLLLETEPAVTQVMINDEKLIVELADGRTIVVPLSWYPRLQHASPKERGNWDLLGEGYAIEWPDLDEHIGIEGLLAGRRSGEIQKSFQRWLASRHYSSCLFFLRSTFRPRLWKNRNQSAQSRINAFLIREKLD